MIKMLAYIKGTLEILNNNTSQELNAVKVRLAKVENRVKEINKVN